MNSTRGISEGKGANAKYVEKVRKAFKYHSLQETSIEKAKPNHEDIQNREYGKMAMIYACRTQEQKLGINVGEGFLDAERAQTQHVSRTLFSLQNAMFVAR